MARHYAGKIYQTHGVANPDFLRVCGSDCNGTLLPIGPMLVYEQLPASNPVKKRRRALHHAVRGEIRQGLRARRSAATPTTPTSCCRMRSPRRLKKAKPGTREFRAALRDALEGANVVGTHGVFVMTPQNHNGLDDRARVMIVVENGSWVLVK